MTVDDSRKRLTSRKLEWLTIVAADRRLKSAATRVAIPLALTFHNHKTGLAWMSMASLGDAAGMSKNTARDGLRMLIELGYVEQMTTGGGMTKGTDQRGLTAEFWIVFRDPKTSGELDPLTAAKQSTPLDPIPRSKAPKTMPNAIQKKTNAIQKTTEMRSRRMERNPLNDSIEDTIEGIPLNGEVKNLPFGSDDFHPREDEAAQSFGAFWCVYPKKVGEKDARKAWAAAIKRANPHDIIDGAFAYRKERAADPRPSALVLQYTTQPAKWLADDRWNDLRPDTAAADANRAPVYENSMAFGDALARMFK